MSDEIYRFWQQKIESLRIAVIGDLIVDRYWFGSADRLSPEAPVPVVDLRSKRDELGGAGNVARNLKSIGVQVDLFGAVGHDENSSLIQSLAREAGIELHAFEVPGRKTACKTRVLSGQHQLLRIDDEDRSPVQEFAGFLEQTIDWQQYDAVIVSDYAKGLINSSTMRAISGKHSLICVDPKPQNYDLYTGVFAITPNASERREIALRNGKDALPAREMIAHLGLSGGVLQTLGADGIAWQTESEDTRYAATSRSVFDVTGAGDTVIATFVAAMAAGLAPQFAAIVANDCAGIVVQKVGVATVTQKECVHSIVRIQS